MPKSPAHCRGEIYAIGAVSTRRVTAGRPGHQELPRGARRHRMVGAVRLGVCGTVGVVLAPGNNITGANELAR